MTHYLPAILGYPDDKVFCFVGKVCVPNPDFVLARARHFEVLRDDSVGLVGTGGNGVPFALATLGPFGRDSWAANTPTWRFGRRQIEIRRIQERLMARRLSNAAHV